MICYWNKKELEYELYNICLYGATHFIWGQMNVQFGRHDIIDPPLRYSKVIIYYTDICNNRKAYILPDEMAYINIINDMKMFGVN